MWGSAMLMGAARGWGGGLGSFPIPPLLSPHELLFSLFHAVKSVAPAALFLAAKVEEQPRKLDYVIKVAHACLHPQEPPPDTRSEVSGVGRVLNHSHGAIGLLGALLCVLGWSDSSQFTPPPLRYRELLGFPCSRRRFVPDLWHKLFCSPLLCQRGSGALHDSVLKAGCFLYPTPRCRDVWQSIGAVWGCSVPTCLMVRSTACSLPLKTARLTWKRAANPVGKGNPRPTKLEDKSCSSRVCCEGGGLAALLSLCWRRFCAGSPIAEPRRDSPLLFLPP